MSLVSRNASVDTLQNGATVTGAGTTSHTETAAAGTLLAEVQETAGGTATVQFQGSFDGSTWYSLGYERVDATGSPSRVVTDLSVSANMAHVYALLDIYPLTRANVSAISSATVTVKLLRTA